MRKISGLQIKKFAMALTLTTAVVSGGTMLAGSSVAAEDVSVKRACQWVASESGVNVRTGPGTDFQVVGQLQAGDSVGIADTNGTCWPCPRTS